MMTISYMDVVKANHDAGVYREYIVQNYGAVLEFGSLSGTYFMARRHCRRLAKLTGYTEEEVVKDIRKDYRSMSEELVEGAL